MSQQNLQSFIALSRTVRFRATAVAAVVIVAALFFGARTLHSIAENAVRSSIDDRLGEQIEDYLAEMRDGAWPSTLSTNGPIAAQLVRENGGVLSASANLSGEPPLLEGFRPQGLRESVAVDGLPFDPDHRYLVMAQRFTRAEDVYTMYVVGDAEPLYAIVGTLRWALIVLVPLLAALVIAMTWFLVGRSLSPIESIRRHAAWISNGHEEERVDERGTDDEPGRLATTMNQILARLGEAEGRQNALSANVSQGLQRPLASIRELLEADLANPEAARPLDTERAVLTETIRLQNLTRDLALLATRNSAPELHLASIDLDHILFAEAERVRGRHPVVVDSLRVAGAELKGDATHLTRLVRTLLEVAARRSAGQVTLLLRQDRRAGFVELVVDDDGPALGDAARDQIFEPFARLDVAAHDGGMSAGVELTMAREAVRWHGGTIRVTESSQGGARFEVRLPIDEAAAPTAWPQSA